MNVLMIGWYKPQIGGGAHAIEETSKLLKEKNKIFIINMEEKELSRVGHWFDGDIEVFQEKQLFGKFFTFQTLIKTTKRAFNLRKKIDLYHAHGVFFAGIGLIDKYKPLVVTIHGRASDEKVIKNRIKKDSYKFKLIRKFEKKILSKADAIIAVSENIRNWIVDDLNIIPKKVFCISNGVNTRKFRKIEIERKKMLPEIPKYRKIVFLAKSLTKMSGIEYLLRSMPFVLSNRDVHLLIAGEGPDKDKFELLCKDINISDNVTFLGLVDHDQIKKYMNIADVYVQPSLTEGFSLSFLEAMASGCPVIASSVGGLEEILQKGFKETNQNIGLLVPPKNSGMLAKEILFLLNSSNESKLMAERARRFVKKNYSWEKIAKDIENVYKYAIKSYNKKLT